MDLRNSWVRCILYRRIDPIQARRSQEEWLWGLRLMWEEEEDMRSWLPRWSILSWGLCLCLPC